LDDYARLQAQARDLCQDEVLREAVWTHCAGLPASAAPQQLSTCIHDGDQMLAHSLMHHQEANASVAQYFNVALQQYHAARQVLGALFPGREGQVSLLDFACGFGRLLRFMSLALPPRQLLASDIQPQACRFVSDEFGVAAIESQADPAAFEPGRKFQLIWVASLFSHLPAGLFEAWLRRLVDCLAPDGVLCFSVHGACLVPDGHAMPASGLLFFPQSENADLDASLYGTTYVSDAWMTEVIARICGPDRPWSRIPRGLAHEQDLYVVAARPGRDLSALEGFRRGPWGWADERRLDQNGELYLRGWAASLDDGALPAVEVTVDGVVHTCPTGLPREDVARVLGDPRLARSGWEFRHRPPSGAGPVRVVVSAPTAGDGRALIFAGRFDRPR